MRDDDLIADGLSEAPQVPLRGVRAAVVAPLLAIAVASAGCDTAVIGVQDAPPPDAPSVVNDAGLYYDAGRVDAPRDADPSVDEDAPAEDAGAVDGGPPLDAG